MLWQIRRHDRRQIKREAASKGEQEEFPNSRAYIDSFEDMGERFFERHPLAFDKKINPHLKKLNFETESLSRHADGTVTAMQTVQIGRQGAADSRRRIPAPRMPGNL